MSFLLLPTPCICLVSGCLRAFVSWSPFHRGLLPGRPLPPFVPYSDVLLVNRPPELSANLRQPRLLARPPPGFRKAGGSPGSAVSAPAFCLRPLPADLTGAAVWSAYKPQPLRGARSRLWIREHCRLYPASLHSSAQHLGKLCRASTLQVMLLTWDPKQVSPPPAPPPSRGTLARALGTLDGRSQPAGPHQDGRTCPGVRICTLTLEIESSLWN